MKPKIEGGAKEVEKMERRRHTLLLSFAKDTFVLKIKLNLKSNISI